MNNFLRVILLVFALMLSHLACAQQDGGSVCVAARADDPFWKEPAKLPDGSINSHGLKLKVDKRPVVLWPLRKSLKVEGLELGERHVMAVLDSTGKPIESLRFRFSDYKSTELCMAYDGYQGIGMKEVSRRTPWCKCH